MAGIRNRNSLGAGDPGPHAGSAPDQPQVRHRAGFIDEIGRENIFAGKTEAIGKIFERLDKNICAHCDKRVFRECQSLPPPVADEIARQMSGRYQTASA